MAPLTFQLLDDAMQRLHVFVPSDDDMVPTMKTDLDTIGRDWKADKVIYGQLRIDLNVIDAQQLETVLDVELAIARKEILAACLQRLNLDQPLNS